VANVAFDKTAVASGDAVSTLTITAFAPAGVDRYILAGIALPDGDTVTSVIKGAGGNFSLVDAQSDVVGGGRAEMWELINPSVTSEDIVLVVSAANAGLTFGICSFNVVHQTTPRAVTVKNTGVGDPTTTHASATDRFDMMVSALARNLNAVPVNCTERWDVMQANEPSGYGSTDPGTMAAKNMQHNYAQNREWAMVAVSIQPSASAGLSANLGLLTETNLVQLMNKAKAKEIGLQTETDLAQTMSRVKLRTIGLLNETDATARWPG